MVTKLKPYELPTDLPELPDGWEYHALAHLVDGERGICYGIVQPGSHSNTGVPTLRVNNIKNGRVDASDVLRVSEDIEVEYTRSRLRGGEVLLTLVGSLGESAVVPESLAGWNVARAVGVIPVHQDIGSRWVELCLRSSTSQHFIRTRATTTVQATLNLRDVAKLPIPVPPKEEREAIALVLGTLDDKIELNRQMNITLEAIVHALFEKLKNESAGRKKVDYLAEINSQTLTKLDDFDLIDYVEISEVSRGNIANTQLFQRGKEPSRARRKLRHGDTVLSTVRPDRRSYFLCLNPASNLIASTGFAVVSPIKAPWSFIHAALTQDEVFDYLGQQADGGAYPAVRPEFIGQLEVPWPSKLSTVEEFHGACAPLYERAEINRRESKTLAALRDTLLPKLLSGELRVREGAESQGLP